LISLVSTSDEINIAVTSLLTRAKSPKLAKETNDRAGNMPRKGAVNVMDDTDGSEAEDADLAEALETSVSRRTSSSRRRKQDLEVRKELPQPRSKSSKTSWTCSVASCKKPTAEARASVALHRVPANPEMRAKWSEACKKELHPQGRVCSRHFTKDDYDRNMMSEFMGSKVKRNLKSIAIPSVFLKKPLSKLDEAKLKRIEDRKEKLERKEIVEELLKASYQEDKERAEREALEAARLNQEHVQVEVVPSQMRSGQNPAAVVLHLPAAAMQGGPIVFVAKSDQHGKKSLFKPKCEVSCQTPNYMNHSESAQRMTEYKTKIRKQNKNLRQYEKKLVELMSEKHRLNVVRHELSKRFSPAQINFMLGHKVRTSKFNRQEMMNAYILRSLSPKTYNFIRYKKMMALPGKSTLRAWVKKGNLDGINVQDVSVGGGADVVPVDTINISSIRADGHESDSDSVSSVSTRDADETPVIDATVGSGAGMDALGNFTHFDRSLTLTLMDASFEIGTDVSDGKPFEVLVTDANVASSSRMAFAVHGIETVVAGTSASPAVEVHPIPVLAQKKSPKKKGRPKKELSADQRLKLRERERKRKRGSTKIFKPQLLQFRSANTIFTQTEEH
jgi:hypothetical protein